jgi:hypothetical protein
MPIKKLDRPPHYGKLRLVDVDASLKRLDSYEGNYLGAAEIADITGIKDGK